ncbi:hypothetical protein OROMI_008815 [Orobanche minor]
MYELWVVPEGRASAHKIYYLDLPWSIGKFLHWRKVYKVKQLLGIGKGNAERREEEIYKRATDAYSALSADLSPQVWMLNFLLICFSPFMHCLRDLSCRYSAPDPSSSAPKRGPFS